MKYWWRNATFEKYNQLTQCLVRQYEDYALLNELRIDGEDTLRENIADNGGVKKAYNAYLKYIRQFGEELPLPALKYTPRQLFWIANAKKWCFKSTPQMSKFNFYNDGHSPEQARVNVVMGNTEEFAVDFKCPLGSPTNSIKRCKIW